MQTNVDKYSEYAVSRYRQIGTTTTRWALFYVAALLYTWQASIYPRAQLINEYMTTVCREDYFDSLSKKTALNKRLAVKTRQKLVDSAYQRLQMAGTDMNLRKRYERQLTILKSDSMSEKNKSALVRLLSEMRNKASEEKNDISDSLKTIFTNYDILLARTQLQKKDAQVQKLSIINDLNISFSIPGMPSVNLGFRTGLIVWMILLFILLAYLFTERSNLIRYLKDIYKLHKRQFKSNTAEWRNLDLKSPFWLAPVVVSDKNNFALFKSFVGWNSFKFNNTLWILLCVGILGIQLHVAWLCWHVSVIRYFESSVLMFLCLLVLSSTILVLLLWLRPISLSTSFFTDQHLDFKRRELLKAGLAASIFLFLIPAAGNKLPLMQGSALGYKRGKKNRKRNYTINLADGFYRYRSKHGDNVYYFHKEKSISMKDICEKDLRRMAQSFEKVEIIDALKSSSANPCKVAHWVPVIENEAFLLAAQGHYETAIHLILLSIGHYVPVHSTFVSGPSFPVMKKKYHRGTSLATTTILSGEASRLFHLVRGLLIRAEFKLSSNRKSALSNLVKEHFSSFNPAIIEQIDLETYWKKQSFVRRWSLSKEIPWHLPAEMPWI